MIKVMYKEGNGGDSALFTTSHFYILQNDALFQGKGYQQRKKRNKGYFYQYILNVLLMYVNM